jgi:hypothetical protein
VKDNIFNAENDEVAEFLKVIKNKKSEDLSYKNLFFLPESPRLCGESSSCNQKTALQISKDGFYFSQVLPGGR